MRTPPVGNVQTPRGEHPNVAITAIARELIAFMWAIAKVVPVTACATVVGVEPDEISLDLAK